MIAILDYDAVAATAVRDVLNRLGVTATVTSAIRDIQRAQKLILPDGLSFARAARFLRDHQLVGPILDACAQGRGILGISLGMHLLLDVSYEEGQHTGLGLLHGKATAPGLEQDADARPPPVRRSGWDRVWWHESACPLLTGLEPGTDFYFDHALHAETLDAAAVRATRGNGLEFAAVLQGSRVFGTQFLPEASRTAGEAVLVNFARA